MRWFTFASLASFALACSASKKGTEPPPNGWANNAPTVIEKVVQRPDAQLLRVAQGPYRTWVKVPPIGAETGDFVLLGQGQARTEVEIPELGKTVPELVDIAHARAVDEPTARRAVLRDLPADAVSVGEVYKQLEQRENEKLVVYGTVTKVAGAIGWYWVHLRDSSGDPTASELDLTVQTKVPPAEGQRVAFEGVLRADVDLGFGYHYEALVEEAEFVQ